MTLRHKIALTFSLVTSGILLLIVGYIYMHSLNYERREFHAKLKERADISIQTHLKADELNREVLGQLRSEHLRSMKGEQEFIVNVEDLMRGMELPAFLDSAFVDRVMSHGEAYHVSDEEVATLGVKEHDNEGIFLIFIAAENEVVQKNLADLRNTLVALVLIYMLLVYSIGLWYASYPLRPLKRMADRMRQIDTYTLSERLEEPGEKDEIWDVAHSFNRMMDRIDTAQKVQQNFISNASHELKNPLTAIIGEIDVTLQRERSNEEYKEAMRVIEHEADRLNRLTLRLLHLAETSYTDNRPLMADVNLAELISGLMEDYRITHPERKFVVTIEAEAESLSVKGNAQLLRIAISNLLDNAIKFSSGAVEVRSGRGENGISVAVSDTGIGIPEQDVESLFIPFFRSDNARLVPGFGIGLPLVKRIMDMHGADLRVASSEAATTFVMVFRT